MAKDGVYNMSPFMEYDPTFARTNGDENCNGYLYKAVNGAIVKQPFKYSVVNNRSYSIENSLLNKENVIPTETIKTHNLSLNFAHGDKIELNEEGVIRVMTVETATPDELDNKAAYLTGRPYKARRITLKD